MVPRPKTNMTTNNRQSPLLIGDTSSNGRLSIVIFVFASVNVMNDAGVDPIFMICVILLWKFGMVMMMTLFWKQMTKWRCCWSLGNNYSITMTWPFFCLDQRPSQTNSWKSTNGLFVVGLSICFPLLGQSTPEMNPFSWRILLKSQHSPPTFGKLRWLTGNMERFEDVIEPEDSVLPA